MSYYANEAQKARLTASLVAVDMFINNLQEFIDHDFSPDAFLSMLENVEGEVAFLKQYVTHNFLVSKDPLSDQNQPQESEFVLE